MNAARGSTEAKNAPRVRLLRGLDRIFHAATAAFAAGILLLVGTFLAVLLSGAWPAIVRYGFGFLTGDVWDGVHNIYGALPAIVGTLLTSGLALLLAVPIALGVAIFLSDIAPPRLREPLSYVVDLTAAIPSVVLGFWAFIVVVPWMRGTVEPALASVTGGVGPFSGPALGLDILTATIVLAVMILPTIAAVSREALRAVPRIQRESALSLGATRWEATRMVALGQARSGIVGGIILGLGRALGETIAVTMVIGNIFQIPTSLLSPGQTLASQIGNNFGEVGPGIGLDALVELGVILFAITLAVNVIARLLIWRMGENGRSDPSRSRWRLRSPWALARRSRRPLGARSSTAPEPWRERVHAAAAARIVRRRTVQWVMVGLTVACVVVALLPLTSVIITAVEHGGGAVSTASFYTSEPPLECNPGPGRTCSLGGIGPAIEGTLILLGVAALFAVPVGLFAGIYLSEYGRRSRHPLARSASFLADVMTGVPTILVGVFVFVLFLQFDHNSATSALSGGLALGVLMLPIVTRATEESLKSVPNGVREAALALGFPRHRVSLRVVLGSARRAVVTGILLALSRAAGDTAALIATAGGSNFWFQGLDRPTAAITPFIFNNFSSSYSNLQEDAWGAALVLLLLMLVISLGARLATRSTGAGLDGE
ncbi:MAG: phosphate ABC transporter permease subunit PstC [Thermoplasmata archaeon]|nr:phosphate ABC transporter permease subunit PstC [Thermoplasmata archaeon]